MTTDRSQEPRPCAVFDVDGVLVDSHSAHFRSWQELADECGCHKMTEDEFSATFGRTTRETISDLWPGSKLTIDAITQLDERKEEIFRNLLRADFRPIPGAAALISDLREAGFGLAAGSSGPPKNVYLTLDQLGCREMFDVVVTGVDVTRGKPDPEVFTICADRLGAAPSSCVVIEDAVVGVTAANLAGALSIALVVEGRDTALFHEAHQIVRSLHELTPEAISRMIMERKRISSRPEYDAPSKSTGGPGQRTILPKTGS